MLIKQKSRILSSEITPESVYLQRRKFLKTAAAAGAVMMSGQACSREIAEANAAQTGGVSAQSFNDKFGDVKTSKFSTDEKMNSWEDITTYNNFYEFGLDKADPSENAHTLVTDPWSVTVSGEADVQGTFSLEDILKPHDFEERIYRLRCVEAWSMVIPWIGIPLGDVLKRFKPNSDAKYVEFRTLNDSKQMPGQRRRVLNWPYREGLRMDEAMNPLAILAVGLYGKVLPNQNGAPLRLVVPWKYGFKSIKSIVSINFTKRMPGTSWEASAPNEYGFYANVNPQVDHPRWSQARERPIGEGLFAKKKPTLMFNGYADEVAELYSDLDLKKNF